MRKKPIIPLDRRNTRSLAPLVKDGVVMGARSEVWCYGKQLILLHLADNKLKEKVQKPSSLFFELVFGNASKYEGPAIILEGEGPWSKIGAEPTYSYNCHAFSLGDRVGLTPRDWVEGECTDASMNTNPTDILLRDYFRPVKQLPATLQAAEALAYDPELCEDDVVSFTRMTKFWGIAHDHSGRVRRHSGENWLASKFREGRLLMTPIVTALNAQTKVIEQIRVYRFREYR